MLVYKAAKVRGTIIFVGFVYETYCPIHGPSYACLLSQIEEFRLRSGPFCGCKLSIMAQ